MKEATGELNSSVLVFMAVALLAAFFFSVIWPNIRSGFLKDESCANAICDPGFNNNLSANCYAPGDTSHIFECPYRG